MSDLTPRDQLAQIIAEAPVNAFGDTLYDANFNVAPDMEKLADAILAAGWRSPARIVTTVEELDALPEGTVVIVAGESYVRTFYCWIEGGYMSPLARSSEEMLRDVGDVFTVIYEPEEGE